MGKIEICLATNNAHKIEELQQMLGDSFELKTLKDIGCFDEIEEYGTTLEENSRIKAAYIHERYNLNVIADDSGLEIEALGNKPGVYSARYAGEPTNHQNNIQKVLTELAPLENKSARLRTVITLIYKNEYHFFEGEVIGKIIDKIKGTEGFGYDPIFVPNGFQETFAEMPSKAKNAISHRGNAVKKLISFLSEKS